MRAHLLGQVRIAVGNREIVDEAWPRRTARSVLLLLLATPGHRVPRDRVLDLLWPEASPKTALNAFYLALSGLRRVLEPELAAGRGSAYVEAGAEVIGLKTDADVWVDVNAFEAALAVAERSPAGARRGSLREALALYGGDLLADEPYADWPVARRERLRREWRRGALALAELDLAAGEPLTGIDTVEAVLAVDGTDEAAHRALMRAYLAAGQRDRAARQYQACLDVLRDELDLEPSDETRELAATLLAPVSERLAPLSSPPTPRRFDNLPTPPNALVGRERAVEELLDLLWRRDVRLVPVTGPGGIGKTRLALEAARQMAEDVADGVGFVGLAALRDPALVVPTIARTLGVEETGGRPLPEALREALRERELLLVVDNMEQVIEAAPAVAELLEGAPRLKVLATSREPLHLRAEHEFPAPPLDLPNPDRLPAVEALDRYEAIELFRQRAAAVRPGFSLTDDNAPAVAALCVRLDGLPLAIELAAARSRTLSPDELLAGLTDRFGLLAGGYRDLPARQRTMRDAVGWSYGLLTEPEQGLFRRLAIFLGGCTVDSAAAVCGAAGPLGVGIREGIASLADKSLVRWEDDGGRKAGARRIAMLETIREFGAEILAASGEEEATRRAHAAHYLAVAEEAGAALWDPEQGERATWLDRLEVEHDNLRAALAWADRHDAETELRLAGALHDFWTARSYYGEGRGWLTRALARGDGQAAPLRAKALHGATMLAVDQGDFEGCVVLGEQCLALYRQLGDKEGTGRTAHVLAMEATYRGDLDRAVAFGEESLALARELGHARGIVVSLGSLGLLTARRGDHHRATVLFAEGLALAQEHEDWSGAAFVLLHHGGVARARGDHSAAARMLGESICQYRDHGDLGAVAIGLQELALVAAARGSAERATRLFGAAEALRETVGVASLLFTEHAEHQRAVAGACAALGEEAFAAAWTAGRELPLERAIAEALAEA